MFPPEKGLLKADLKHGPAAGKMLGWGIIYAPSAILSSAAISSQEGAKPFLKSALLNSALVNFSYALIMSSAFSDDESSLKAISNGIRAGFKGTFNLNHPKFPAGITMTSLSKSFVLGSAKSNENFAQKLHLEQVFTQQAFLAPILLKAMAGKKESQERTRELEISQHAIGLGTTSIKLTAYKGEQPFVIKTPQGETITEVRPGNPLAFMHVSHQAKFLHDLAPMEKVQQITNDFIDLLRAVENNEFSDLNEKQQKTMNRAQSATIIGISHLVRLFGRKTGLPTWKLGVLPELVQRFHQHDSQAVSRAFGGTRKVKTEDVEMMVITPAMRQQLVATI